MSYNFVAGKQVVILENPPLSQIIPDSDIANGFRWKGQYLYVDQLISDPLTQTSAELDTPFRIRIYNSRPLQPEQYATYRASISIGEDLQIAVFPSLEQLFFTMTEWRPQPPPDSPVMKAQSIALALTTRGRRWIFSVKCEDELLELLSLFRSIAPESCSNDASISSSSSSSSSSPPRTTSKEIDDLCPPISLSVPISTHDNISPPPAGGSTTPLHQSPSPQSPHLPVSSRPSSLSSASSSTSPLSANKQHRPQSSQSPPSSSNGGVTITFSTPVLPSTLPSPSSVPTANTSNTQTEQDLSGISTPPQPGANITAGGGSSAGNFAILNRRRLTIQQEHDDLLSACAVDVNIPIPRRLLPRDGNIKNNENTPSAKQTTVNSHLTPEDNNNVIHVETSHNNDITAPVLTDVPNNIIINNKNTATLEAQIFTTQNSGTSQNIETIALTGPAARLAHSKRFSTIPDLPTGHVLARSDGFIYNTSQSTTDSQSDDCTTDTVIIDHTDRHIGSSTPAPKTPTATTTTTTTSTITAQSGAISITLANDSDTDHIGTPTDLIVTDHFGAERPGSVLPRPSLGPHTKSSNDSILTTPNGSSAYKSNRPIVHKFAVTPEERRNERFRQLFGFSHEEKLIMDWTSNKNLQARTVYVSALHLCIFVQTLGYQSRKMVLNLSDISRVMPTTKGDGILVKYSVTIFYKENKKREKLTLSSFDDVSGFINTLQNVSPHINLLEYESESEESSSEDSETENTSNNNAKNTKNTVNRDNEGSDDDDNDNDDSDDDTTDKVSLLTYKDSKWPSDVSFPLAPPVPNADFFIKIDPSEFPEVCASQFPVSLAQFWSLFLGNFPQYSIYDFLANERHDQDIVLSAWKPLDVPQSSGKPSDPFTNAVECAVRLVKNNIELNAPMAPPRADIYKHQVAIKYTQDGTITGPVTHITVIAYSVTPAAPYSDYFYVLESLTIKASSPTATHASLRLGPYFIKPPSFTMSMIVSILKKRVRGDGGDQNKQWLDTLLKYIQTNNITPIVIPSFALTDSSSASNNNNDNNKSSKKKRQKRGDVVTNVSTTTVITNDNNNNNNNNNLNTYNSGTINSSISNVSTKNFKSTFLDGYLIPFSLTLFLFLSLVFSYINGNYTSGFDRGLSTTAFILILLILYKID